MYEEIDMLLSSCSLSAVTIQFFRVCKMLTVILFCTGAFTCEVILKHKPCRVIDGTEIQPKTFWMHREYIQSDAKQDTTGDCLMLKTFLYHFYPVNKIQGTLHFVIFVLVAFLHVPLQGAVILLAPTEGVQGGDIFP